MKNFRRFCALIILAAAITVPAFAGETNTPPCNPGETQTPPCTAPGETQGPWGAAPGDISTPGLALILLAVQSAL